ncbi:hypothetical protein ACG74X_00750 [Marivita sp. S0852]|uniref:hypothetical protein n=1 Tax=Marivita sp. S0852 TaxID=3373893 RepID=UPI003981E9DE
MVNSDLTEGAMTPVPTTNADQTTIINVPEAVGVFENFDDFQKAFYDLRMMGFSRYDLSVLGREEDLVEKLGKSYFRAADLEDDPRVPRASFVSEEAMGELEGAIVGGAFFIPSYIAMAVMAAAGGAVAATAAAVAIVGVPALVIGSLLARRVGQQHKDYYAHQIERGGILLWVRVQDEEKRNLAVETLKAHSGKDVHVHEWST